MAKWLCIDPLAEKYYAWTPYNYVTNNPLRFIDPDGRDGWPTVNEWDQQYAADFQEFIVEETNRIRTKAGVNYNERICNPERGGKWDEDICFDCADFAIALIVRFAAAHKLPLTLTIYDGSGMTEVDNTMNSVEISGKKTSINGARGFETLVRDHGDTETIKKDSYPTPQIQAGDFLNNGGHVAVVKTTPIAEIVSTYSGTGSSYHDGIVPSDGSHRISEPYYRFNVLSNLPVRNVPIDNALKGNKHKKF